MSESILHKKKGNRESNISSDQMMIESDIDRDSNSHVSVDAPEASSSAESKSKSNSTPKTDPSATKRRKDMFGDCALIEIIHLHDCLRGALKALETDVTKLSHSILHHESQKITKDLERRVAGRFKVIWSVFRAHSAAEDEFIWPALKTKTGKYLGSPKCCKEKEMNPGEALVQGQNGHEVEKGYKAPASLSSTNDQNSKNICLFSSDQACSDQPSVIEQEEYEEDHADEERMFKSMDELLRKLRESMGDSSESKRESGSIYEIAKGIQKLTSSLMQHLMVHLEKEETQCMPLVVKYLNKEEINDLVGRIMGKRSSETIANIMSMAIENLEEKEHREMVRYMKQAMVGTFFEKWLAMSGWMTEAENSEQDKKIAAETTKHIIEDSTDDVDEESPSRKKLKTGEVQACVNVNPLHEGITSKNELERLIRAIVNNPALSPVQKNTTIQGLRDSVWKSNLRNQFPLFGNASSSTTSGSSTGSNQLNVTLGKRDAPPSAYYRKETNGEVKLIWSRETEKSSQFMPLTLDVPLFSALELAPTYHDGAHGVALGCPHYARSCKLRHPKSGRLYTCRLCCDQVREHPLKDHDAPLDRYSVTEVFCMRCGTLQPSNERCINMNCESNGAPFARYYCKICNLYDDGPKRDIFHCPFCNTCKIGKGLGIDFRHCMRCNACVSLADDVHHCIPQRLQACCPICHETMFESTEPLKGLKCGHVMHLSCFNMYIRGGSYTCPLCKKSVEDMKEYFSLLDAAVRMQPMPTAYQSTVSNIYCQDCNQTSKVPYHFVGCKCTCGSYNTRELGRVQNQFASANSSY
jgi:iron-sulfur cluster repair protein YtfE (RIC family)